MTTNPQDLDALVRKLRSHKGLDALQMWNMRDRAADAITTLLRDLLAAEAAGRAEYARGLRDAAAQAYEVAHNTNDISQIRDAILAMIPEGK
jgi:GrpB-like predicted nucleotidyltransferase (UPF0157 family)